MIRHPEKIKKFNPTTLKKPNWLKVKAPTSKKYFETLDIVNSHNLVTVCQEAACPNIGECWEKKHATFMILGDTCTRACAFCNVKTGKPSEPPDPMEPLNVAKSVLKLGLKHVVVTSVDRDDLPDGGAQHFIDTIKYIRELSNTTTIEILTPDFFSTYARLPKANITKLNLSEICLVYIDEYKRNYDQIIINYKIEDNLYVHFDHSYLDIIFNNLFKNSIEALNSTKNPEIEITLKFINSNLILTFFDNGPGYDGNIEDLKKPYFSTKKSTGLGLSLIDKIITDNSHKMNITTNSYSGFKIEIVFNDKNISN